MYPSIKPFPKQDEAWKKLLDKETKYIIYGGAAGGGKSYLGCQWIFSQAWNYPETKWFIGREELKRLMASSFMTWHEMCKKMNIPKSEWIYNGQYNYLELVRRGSRIDLLDLKYLPSDPMYERFGSLEFTGGWIEEAGEIDFEAFDVLKSRINRRKNKEYDLLGKMLLTCNPNKGWLYSTVYLPHRKGTLPKEYAFIQSLHTDNPHTADSYGESLKDIRNEATKQRLMFGNWEYDDDPARLIEYDALVDLFTNKTKESPERCLTIDVARFGDDLAVILYWEGFQVRKVYTYERTSIDFLQETAKEICNKYKIPRSNVIADEEGVGGGFVDNFKCKGFVGNSTAIPSVLGEKYNFANLRTQCFYLLADKINRREIGIDDNKYQERIIQELEQIREKNVDKDTKLAIIPKEQMKEALGRSPDFADSLSMRMWFELPGHSIGKPIRRDFVIEYDGWGKVSNIGKKQDDWLKV